MQFIMQSEVSSKSIEGYEDYKRTMNKEKNMKNQITMESLMEERARLIQDNSALIATVNSQQKTIAQLVNRLILPREEEEKETNPKTPISHNIRHTPFSPDNIQRKESSIDKVKQLKLPNRLKEPIEPNCGYSVSLERALNKMKMDLDKRDDIREGDIVDIGVHENNANEQMTDVYDRENYKEYYHDQSSSIKDDEGPENRKDRVFKTYIIVNDDHITAKERTKTPEESKVKHTVVKNMEKEDK